MDVPRAALLRAGVPLTGGAMTKKSHELFDLEAAFKPDDTCPDCRIDRLGYKKNVDDTHCWRSHGTDKTEVAQPVVSEGDPADLAVTLDIAAGEAPRRRLTNMAGLPRVRGSRAGIYLIMDTHQCENPYTEALEGKRARRPRGVTPGAALILHGLLRRDPAASQSALDRQSSTRRWRQRRWLTLLMEQLRRDHGQESEQCCGRSHESHAECV